jgi:hypothetical protein
MLLIPIHKKQTTWPSRQVRCGSAHGEEDMPVCQQSPFDEWKPQSELKVT